MLIDGYVVHIDTTDIRAQTAEWENRLTEIAKGNADADEFMAEIEAQVDVYKRQLSNNS